MSFASTHHLQSATTVQRRAWSIATYSSAEFLISVYDLATSKSLQTYNAAINNVWISSVHLWACAAYAAG